jgi:hypothetical protein
MASTLQPGEVFALDALAAPTAHGIASRVLARTAAGNITLFAFDAGEELSQHTAPFDALVLTFWIRGLVDSLFVLVAGDTSSVLFLLHQLLDRRPRLRRSPACRPSR